MPGTFDRRALLKNTPLGMAGLGLALATACQAAPSAQAPAAAATPSPGGYPTTVPDTLSPKPDLPSTGQWIDNAYSNYPPNPAKSVSETPGRGGTLTYFTQAVYPPATPLDRSTAWQETNRQLNTQVQMNFTTPADYPAKLAELMAGNDLPDMFALWQGLGTAQRLTEFLQAQAADLTPFLAGDAIKKYPNLALLPQLPQLRFTCFICGATHCSSCWCCHGGWPGAVVSVCESAGGH